MSTCKCPHCGNDINPASLLGKGKKTMSLAATEQRRKAAQSRWAKVKGDASDAPDDDIEQRVLMPKTLEVRGVEYRRIDP